MLGRAAVAAVSLRSPQPWGRSSAPPTSMRRPSSRSSCRPPAGRGHPDRAALTTTSVGQTILVVVRGQFSAVLLLSLLFGEGDTSFGGQILFLVVFAAVTAAGSATEALPAHRPRRPHGDAGRWNGAIGIRLAVLLLGVFLAMSSRFGLERSSARSWPGSSSRTCATTSRARRRGSGRRSTPSASASSSRSTSSSAACASTWARCALGQRSRVPMFLRSSCCAAAYRRCCSAAGWGAPTLALLRPPLSLSSPRPTSGSDRSCRTSTPPRWSAAVLAMLIFPLSAQSLLADPASRRLRRRPVADEV